MVRSLSFVGRDRNTLAAEGWGDGEPPSVVLLHGGGQTRAAWGATGATLASHGWPAVAVDLRGHGDSEWSAEGDYGIEAFGGDVVSVVQAIGTPVVLVGASLGGLGSLVALDLAPDLAVAGLMLVDIAHRFDLHGARRITEFMSARPEGFDDLAQAARAVAEYLPHRPPPPDADGLQRNLRAGANGKLRWHWDPRVLDSAGRMFDDAHRRDTERRLRGVLERLTVPARLVRGGDSDVVTPAIGTEFATLSEHADVVEVPGARHMVAGDRNDTFTAAVLEFLTSRVGSARAQQT